MDPVNVVFGDFVWQYSDLTIGGKHDLAFTRVYDNQAQVAGALGNKWSTNFSYKLEADSTNG
ncbi:MAG: DUF6531 domain-containing protein [Clostridiales bacterium]|nr:DUF6531 domain-containing protein [Clostridiales bacterium]